MLGDNFLLMKQKKLVEVEADLSQTSYMSE